MVNVPKSILDLLSSLKIFMVQHNQATMVLGQVAIGLGVVASTFNGGSTKPIIKAKLLDSFTRKKPKQSKCDDGYTKLKFIWKPNALIQTRNKFISFKHSSRNRRGIVGCPKSKKHIIYLRFSFGKNSSCNWMKAWCYTTWCWKIGWNEFLGPLCEGFQHNTNRCFP